MQERLRRSMVGMRGLEPPSRLQDCALNAARLPIPPHAQNIKKNNKVYFKHCIEKHKQFHSYNETVSFKKPYAKISYSRVLTLISGISGIIDFNSSGVLKSFATL